MPTLPKPLTKRNVEAFAPGVKPFIAWRDGDGAVRGFGVLVRPTGKRTFVFQ